MANHNTDNSTGRNHRVFSSFASDLDLLAENPRYAANDATTHKLPREIQCLTAGNLIVRYEGMTADADTVAATAGMVFDIAPRTIKAGSTGAYLVIW